MAAPVPGGVTQPYPFMSEPWFPFLQLGANNEPALPAPRTAA